jgi:hypothetical protein
MSFGIAILLSEKKLPTDSYLAFVDSCASVVANRHIDETSRVDPNAETVHDFVGANGGAHHNGERGAGVFVTLERREFTKKYGRSRRKIFWQIYTETKARLWSVVPRSTISVVGY